MILEVVRFRSIVFILYWISYRDFIGYYLEMLRYYKEVFRQRKIIVDDMGAADGPLCMDVEGTE